MGHVVIVGGGIAGLALGAALERAGVGYSIHEQAPQLHDVGAGIGLWPNALRALDRLGVADEIVDRAGGGADMQLRRWDGRVLMQDDARDYRNRWGWSPVGALRSDLQTLLLSNVDDRWLHLGRRAKRIAADDRSVTVTFENGDEVVGDVVVGADGLWSVVRDSVVGDGGPRPVGTVAWLGISEAPVDVMFETLGPGRKFVGLSHGSRGLWGASMLVADRSRGGGPEKAFLTELFGDWHDPIPALLQGADEPTIIRRDVFSRRRLRRWSAGRVAVIGDAAHPMVPDLGQGGCQALEDAIVFADHLAAAARDGGRLSEAMAAAAEERRRRAARAAMVARGFQWITHRRNPVVQRATHVLLAAPPKPVRFRQLDSIVGPPVRTR